MFCKNCGKEIPDNVQFCNNCGAAQEENPTPEQAFQQYEASKPSVTEKPKKEKSILVIVGIVIVVLAFVGKIAASGSEESNNGDFVSDSTETRSLVELPEPEVKSSTETEVNPEYTKIFQDRNIVAIPEAVVGDYAAFAKVEEDDTILSVEFGYKDDVISMIAQTLIFDVKDMSDSEKEVLEASLREKYGEGETLDFVTITSSIGTDILTFCIRADRLDEEEILKIAEEKDIIGTTGDGGLLSMSGTESDLLSLGYIKR